MATPLPFFNYPASTDPVNMRVAVSDIPLGGAKAELSFWAQNLLNTVRPAFTFASGNGINAASQAAQSTIYLAPPRVLGGELRVEFRAVDFRSELTGAFHREVTQVEDMSRDARGGSIWRSFLPCFGRYGGCAGSEAEDVGSGLQDMAVVGEPMEQRGKRSREPARSL